VSKTIELLDADATLAFGEELGSTLAAGAVILLTGDLGSGKTTLVQGIAKALEINDAIVSPTFAIINEYLEGKYPLYHLDLYRLDPPAVNSLNLESYWDGTEFDLGIMAIEWPDRLTYLPPHYLKINIAYRQPEGRKIEICEV
jgi:tRNA threonylcarbamoyladenosine biosynthesis protein TsaE